jgi:hypothetical protein
VTHTLQGYTTHFSPLFANIRASQAMARIVLRRSKTPTLEGSGKALQIYPLENDPIQPYQGWGGKVRESRSGAIAVQESAFALAPRRQEAL